MPKGVYERKPKNASGATQSREAPKRRGTTSNGAGDAYALLVSSLRVEKERLEDKIVALGTAIEALEAIEA